MTLQQTVRATADNQSATLSTPDPSITEWIDEYIGEWWNLDRAAPGIDAHRPIVASIDQDLYEEISRRTSADGHPISTFIRTPGRRWDEGDLTYVDVPSRAVSFRLDRAAGRLEIVGADEDQTKLEASRFLRNTVTERLERDGWTVMHAACIVTDGDAVLFIGEKGAGKTTTSLTACIAWGASSLANDRCLVKVVRGELKVLPWPGSISVGFGLLASLGWFQDLSAAMRTGTRQHPFQDPKATAKLATGQASVSFGEDGREVKAEIMPRDLTRLFGVPLSREARVTRIIFPAVHRDGQTGFSPTDHTAESLLEHTLHGPGSGYPDFLSLGETDQPKDRRATWEALDYAAAIPQYSLRLGWDPRANARFLDQERR